MPRKIFLSFLGITNYGECTYTTSEGEVPDVRFVQEATIQLYCPDCDRYIFFLTPDAERKNWHDDGHALPQEGLRAKLVKRGLADQLRVVPNVPLGTTEEEIWAIFDLILRQVEEGDKVYIDITHALRYIPMLLLSFIHYAKFIKRIEVGGIYYGVFEPGVQPARFPILDLTAFSQLQDWTSAANTFINFGSGDAMARLMRQTGQPDMADAVLNFCRNISAVRYLDIHSGRDAAFLADNLSDASRPSSVPLDPILGRVKDKIAVFGQSQVANGLAAVDWCIQHNLIQQGLTILFEYVQVQVLHDLGEADWRAQKKRNIISWALSKVKIDAIQEEYENGKMADELFLLAQRAFELPYKKKLTEIYLNLGQGTRHDMNHAGIRDDPKSAEELASSLQRSYQDIKRLLNPS